MFPCFPGPDLEDCGLIHIKHSRENICAVSGSPNKPYRCLGQFASSVPLSTSAIAAPFPKAISDVFFLGGKKKMRRIAASAVVAGMANVQPIGNWPAQALKRYSMSKVRPLAAMIPRKRKYPVPDFLYGPTVRPTAIRPIASINLRPKATENGAKLLRSTFGNESAAACFASSGYNAFSHRTLLSRVRVVRHRAAGYTALDAVQYSVNESKKLARACNLWERT